VVIILFVIILFGSFLPNMDTCEFSKIPQLIEHYKEHTEERGQSMSFFDFIELHYGLGKESGEHRGQENHDSLPLQHQHSFHVVALQLTEPLNFTFYTNNPMTTFNSGYLYTEYSEYSFTLLLPPKV